MINDNLFKGYNVNARGNGIEVTQDIAPHLEWAKHQRDLNKGHRPDTGFRALCNVPDSVALDIMTKHRINIHDVNIQPEEMRKFKQIMRSEYPQFMYHQKI